MSESLQRLRSMLALQTKPYEQHCQYFSAVTFREYLDIRKLTDVHGLRLPENRTHNAHLMSTLIHIYLVDAQRIHPEIASDCSIFVFDERTEGLVEIQSHQMDLSVELDRLTVVWITPYVAVAVCVMVSTGFRER